MNNVTETLLILSPLKTFKNLSLPVMSRLPVQCIQKMFLFRHVYISTWPLQSRFTLL